MSPKKAPPTLPRQQTLGSLLGHEPPASPRGPIAWQWGQDSIKLNVHRPNGDLIVEATVKVDDFIGGFSCDLDYRGLVPVEPLVNDQNKENDDPTTTYVDGSGETRIFEPHAYVNELVWNGMILSCDRQFGYYVHGYGMSVSEPVNATLCRAPSPTAMERGIFIVSTATEPFDRVLR